LKCGEGSDEGFSRRKERAAMEARSSAALMPKLGAAREGYIGPTPTSTPVTTPKLEIFSKCSDIFYDLIDNE
jgi:hypothetical protein